MDKEYLVRTDPGLEPHMPHDVYHGHKKIITVPFLVHAQNVAKALTEAHKRGADEYKESIKPKLVDLTVNGYTPPRYLPPYPTEWLADK